MRDAALVVSAVLIAVGLDKDALAVFCSLLEVANVHFVPLPCHLDFKLSDGHYWECPVLIQEMVTDWLHAERGRRPGAAYLHFPPVIFEPEVLVLRVIICNSVDDCNGGRPCQRLKVELPLQYADDGSLEAFEVPTVFSIETNILEGCLFADAYYQRLLRE
jgi:hypothetical protein